MKRLVVLISNVGTGSNLQAIIRAQKSQILKMQIIATICDTKDAIGLTHARKNKIPIIICPDNKKLFPILKKIKPDYIALAGWKQIITDDVIKNYPNKILNLHPGLIPDTPNGIVYAPDRTKALWNRGLLGQKAVQNFLDKGATYAGSSIHFLTNEFDFGPVLARTFEKIKKSDTVESLYLRLKKKEHAIYTKTLRTLADKSGIKVLVLDGGGRGSILVEKYLKSKNVEAVLAIPGNDFIRYQQHVTTFPNIKTTDIKQIIKIAKKEKVCLVDVAQDDAVSAGLVDALRKNKIDAFGPTRLAGQIEWDKSWSRNFMKKFQLPSPAFKAFNSEQSGIEYINGQQDNKWYVKASGLAAGKGAIPAKNNADAIDAIKEMGKFGNAGSKYLIEQYLEGEEFSAFAAVNASKFRIIGYAQDHKRVSDGDAGPNTGGMGCSSPPKIITREIENQVEKIFKKTVKGLVELNRPYTGILYMGGIIDAHGKVWIIEFNARWGDPEAQVILPAVNNDYYDFVTNVLSASLPQIKKDKKYRVTVAATSNGYPGNYTKELGKKIIGLDKIVSNNRIFGAGIKKEGKDWTVAGGRLFYVLGEGANVAQARKIAYNALSKITIDHGLLHYRKDIGYRDLERFKGGD